MPFGHGIPLLLSLVLALSVATTPAPAEDIMRISGVSQVEIPEGMTTTAEPLAVLDGLLLSLDRDGNVVAFDYTSGDAEAFSAGDWLPESEGLAIAHRPGVLYVAGGPDSSAAWEVKWKEDRSGLDYGALPDLPVPVESASITHHQGMLVVAGGISADGVTGGVHALDLADPRQWTPHSTLPVGLHGGVLVSQDSGNGHRLYYFAGSSSDGVSSAIDYMYDPEGREWVAIAERDFALSSHDAAALGLAHIWVPGVEGLRAFHTVTASWTEEIRILNLEPRGVPTRLFPKDRGLVLLRSPHEQEPATHLEVLEIPRRVSYFATLDYIILGVYFVGLLGIGVFFFRSTGTTKDFFLAGKRIPWWAAGISIFGTQLSAITFIAIPARAYSSDWLYFIGMMFNILVAPVIIYLFLPFFRRLDVTTAYEYLQRRFNPLVRGFASVSFVLFQFARIGIVLLLPALTLSAVVGIDVRVSIIVIGVISTVYTILGGMEAVIWTDVLQVVVLAGGAILSLVLVVLGVGADIGPMLASAQDMGKMRLAIPSWDITMPSLFVMSLSIAATITPYISDQVVIQRYLTTKDEKAAAKSIWMNAIITIPGGVIFFSIGTALWLYYRSHPMALDPAMRQTDEIFPLFIVTHFPAGFAGLVIAAIFAASMSSLDSAMNSISTSVTEDLFRAFKPNSTDRLRLTVAKSLTLFIGVGGTAAALILASFEVRSLWEEFMKVVAIAGSSLAGLFFLGIFTRRANAAGAIAAIIVTPMVIYYVSVHTPVSFLTWSMIGIVTCVSIGYFVSLLFPNARKETDGLCLYQMPKEIK